MHTEVSSSSSSRRRLTAGLLGLVLLLAVGCRQDMHDQMKYEPLEGSTLFSDGTSARPFPIHTVARGSLGETDTSRTGVLADGSFALELPMALDEQVLERGEERFNIYCSPCHDRTGSGRGMIVQRGFAQPPTFHQDRLREMPVGYLFDVASNGYGQMSGYKSQVKASDRWAITAWIRVLQRSQNVQLSSLSEQERRYVEEGKSLLEVADKGSHGEGHGDDH